MVSFSLLFTLGVWYLQQQPALPALSAYWPLAAFVLLLPRANGKALIFARSMALLVCAALLGYCYAAWTAQHRLSDKLADEWQGKTS